MATFCSAAHVLSARRLPVAAHRRARLLGSAAGAAAMQSAFDLARAGDLGAAREAMDGVTAEDAGLRAGGPGLEPGGPIGYHHIISDRSLSMSVFVLPAGSAIPLHDHPEMAVLSKVLFGALRVTSYDMPERAPPPVAASLFGGRSAARRLRVGAPSTRTVAAPCAPIWLEPRAGNIHAFEALEHTAILNILTPPYDDAAGRSCHYYEVAGGSAPGGRRPAPAGEPSAETELVEVPWPGWLRVENRPYEGVEVRL